MSLVDSVALSEILRDMLRPSLDTDDVLDSDRAVVPDATLAVIVEDMVLVLLPEGVLLDEGKS